jgi:uncharacterized protein (DUF983 family)
MGDYFGAASARRIWTRAPNHAMVPNMDDTTHTTPRPIWPAMRRGLAKTCPNCGKASVFDGYLTLKPACPYCAQNLSHARADDGPAYLSILVTAKIMGTLMLFVYERFFLNPWAMAIIFSIGVSVMALYLLPRFKGMIVGIQWANRMHGF